MGPSKAETERRMWWQETHPLIQLCVHGHNEDDGGMGAAQRSKQQEAGEVCVVQMSAAVVDPRAVVVHLHYAPEEGEQKRTWRFYVGGEGH